MPNEGNLITNNKKILNIGKEIARIFNLNWLYDCDFMFDRKKNPVVIEINPRMSGSAVVGSYAGLNLFENLVDLYLNKSIKKALNQGDMISEIFEYQMPKAIDSLIMKDITLRQGLKNQINYYKNKKIIE